MGGRGTAAIRNRDSGEPEKFVYERSPEIKPWSEAEEKRTKEMSKYVDHMVFRLGEDEEFYKENIVNEIEKVEIPGGSNFTDEEVTITKMNLIYTQNWDENDRRVKKGKALTGSTYYTVEDSYGAIDEAHFAYKTKADAEHAMKLYIDEERQKRDYYNRRTK